MRDAGSAAAISKAEAVAADAARAKSAAASKTEAARVFLASSQKAADTARAEAAAAVANAAREAAAYPRSRDTGAAHAAARAVTGEAATTGEAHASNEAAPTSTDPRVLNSVAALRHAPPSGLPGRERGTVDVHPGFDAVGLNGSRLLSINPLPSYNLAGATIHVAETAYRTKQGLRLLLRSCHDGIISIDCEFAPVVTGQGREEVMTAVIQLSVSGVQTGASRSVHNCAKHAKIQGHC